MIGGYGTCTRLAALTHSLTPPTVLYDQISSPGACAGTVGRLAGSAGDRARWCVAAAGWELVCTALRITRPSVSALARARGRRGAGGVRVQPRGSAAHARAASLYVSIKSEREHRQCSVRTQHVSQSSPLRPRQGTRAAGAAGNGGGRHTTHTHTHARTRDTLRGESTSSSRDGGGKARIHRVPLPNVTVSTTICPDAYHKLACTCIKYLGLAHSSDATSYNTGPAVRCVRLLFA